MEIDERLTRRLGVLEGQAEIPALLVLNTMYKPPFHSAARGMLCATDYPDSDRVFPGGGRCMLCRYAAFDHHGMVPSHHHHLDYIFRLFFFGPLLVRNPMSLIRFEEAGKQHTYEAHVMHI